MNKIHIPFMISIITEKVVDVSDEIISYTIYREICK